MPGFIDLVSALRPCCGDVWALLISKPSTLEGRVLRDLSFYVNSVPIAIATSLTPKEHLAQVSDTSD